MQQSELGGLSPIKEKLITSLLACKYLGVSRPTFNKMRESGKIRYYQLNKRKLYKISDLNELV